MVEYYKGTQCGYCNKPITDNTAILCHQLLSDDDGVLLHDGQTIAEDYQRLSVSDNCNLSFTLTLNKPMIKQRVELTDKL